jgi:hypothetical protein
MDPIHYIANIALVASSWMAGIFVARYLMRKFFKIDPDGPDVVGSISSDDLMDIDKAEKPFIPVKIINEEGLYYAWFSNNNKFIGQSKSTDELRVMAHEHLVKAFGLRFEFTHEDKATVKLEKSS